MRTFIDSFKLIYYKVAASGLLSPKKYQRTQLPESGQLRLCNLPIKLEIVSHCWRYSHLLVYQLSSLIKYTPTKAIVTMTVFYSHEDQATVKILQHFRAMSIPNVSWNFIALEKQSLFRRSIGRNLAAKNSHTDWVWFTDCDVLFYENCLDALAEKLAQCPERLVFPRQLLYSKLMAEDDPLLVNGKAATGAVALPKIGGFGVFESRKAMGPIQIVHGDIARAAGYCETIALFQKPVDSWAKAHEDRVFRWLLGTDGVAIEVPNVVVLRHLVKGRYSDNSAWSQLRIFNRTRKERLN
jgi:hypothetical protein